MKGYSLLLLHAVGKKSHDQFDKPLRRASDDTIRICDDGDLLGGAAVLENIEIQRFVVGRFEHCQLRGERDADALTSHTVGGVDIGACHGIGGVEFLFLAQDPKGGAKIGAAGHNDEGQILELCQA